MSYRLACDQTNISSDAEQKKGRRIENVLIMQGGGSLGAFACGVYKALVEKNIRIDIAAGTSIGAVNAAIIVGSKSDRPEKDLEEFWIEVSESNYHIIPDIIVPEYDKSSKTYTKKKISSASANAAIFGIPKMFVPRWSSWLYVDDSRKEQGLPIEENKEGIPNPFFDVSSWTYVFDHSPLARTLDKYIDYKKMNHTGQLRESPHIRLIMTAVDVLTAKPLIFDSTKMEIKAKHILASSGYPVYGFPWINIEDNNKTDETRNGGTYAWDGSLLSNTPVREVLSMSPRNDKNFFVVENYPRKVKRLPSNMAEVESRAKDIIFSDKNMDTIKMSRLITRQIRLIERLYKIFDTGDNEILSKFDPNETKEIKSEYNKLIENYGARILSVTRIVRSEIESPTILQNADFSSTIIKELISQGESKTFQELLSCEKDRYDFNWQS
jgi:NTE family protein